MVYVNGTVMIICTAFTVIFFGYFRGHLKNIYRTRGIYSFLYPAAYFLYKVCFRRHAEKKLPAIKILYPCEDAYVIQQKRYIRNISNAIIILMIFNAAAIVLYAYDTGKTVLIDGIYIERASPGGGNQEVELIAQIGDESQKVLVNVEERRLHDNELEELWKICEDSVRMKVLGNNIGLDHITEDLNFISEIPGYSVSVQWQSSDYNIVSLDGTVKNEDLAAPECLTLTAICSYYEEKREYYFDITVYPLVKNEQVLRREALRDAVLYQEQKTVEDDFMILPDSINGEAVAWTQSPGVVTIIVSALGCLCVVLIFVRENERYAKAQKKRSCQLIEDYPVFVHKVVLLLGCGMTSKAVWFRIISDYNKGVEKGGEKRYVYEEMIVAANEMKQGITEITAYENFGRRCQTSQYLKFSSILIQSVKTGARGMARMLSDAGEEAMLLRRENAKRIGEEAGTKLLFPMVVLLAIVMVIIIIPAFMATNF